MIQVSILPPYHVDIGGTTNQPCSNSVLFLGASFPNHFLPSDGETQPGLSQLISPCKTTLHTLWHPLDPSHTFFKYAFFHHCILPPLPSKCRHMCFHIISKFKIVPSSRAKWFLLHSFLEIRFRAQSHTAVMDYDEACFMHLTPGVVHNFPKAVGV